MIRENAGKPCVKNDAGSERLRSAATPTGQSNCQGFTHGRRAPGECVPDLRRKMHRLPVEPGRQRPRLDDFVDESGRDVTLRQYFDKPVILALVYYQCPSLCNLVLNGVLSSTKQVDLTAGKQYEVVAVSFDPRETPQMAAAKKQNYLANDRGEDASAGTRRPAR